MVRKATLLKICLLMVEVTSIPLIVLALIYVLSGYQMLAPVIRIIPEPRRIHTDKFLRILTIFLAYLHALGGIVIMAERRIKEETLRKIAEIVAIVVLTTMLVTSLAIETLVLDIGYRHRWGRGA